MHTIALPEYTTNPVLYYLYRQNEPLDLDLVETLGLDGTGRDGDPRFPYTWANLTADERGTLLADVYSRVVAATADEINVMMAGYGHALYQLSVAVVDGDITEDELRAFPLDNPTEAAVEALAEAIPAPYVPSYGTRIFNENGWPESIDGDDICVAVSALLAIPAGDACRNDTVDGSEWQFWPDSLDGNNVTIEEVRFLWASLTLAQAAQLVLDSNNRTVDA